VRLDGGAHGMIVRREIEERTGRNISIGAVYATLERLEAKRVCQLIYRRTDAAARGRAKRRSASKRLVNGRWKVSEQTIRSMTAGLKDRWGTI